MDIEKHIRHIWHKHEVEVGQRIRPEFKEAVKNLMGCDYYNENYVKELDGLISDYIKLSMAWGGVPSSDRNSKANALRKKYPKCFNRRLYLADFILSRIYSAQELYIPLATNTSLPKRRVDWKKMLTEWNEVHPSDQMTLPVLKVEFYRAIGEEDVMQEILAREWRETEYFQQLFQKCRDGYSQFGVNLTKVFRDSWFHELLIGDDNPT